MGKKILINQLFSGRYLEEGENIGHEAINLFKDDNGNNNLFVTKSGSVMGHDVEYIIFVRHVSSKQTVEVIGLADGLRSITKEEMNQIRYAGVSLDQIFSSNIYKGKTDDFSDHVTFRADNLRFPVNRIFITIDRDFCSTEKTVLLDTNLKAIAPESMRVYFSDEDNPAAYKALMELITNNDYWESVSVAEKLVPDGVVLDKHPSFLEVIRKENDENIFSNLLAYFFEYSHLSFQKFAAEESLLDIPNMSVFFTVLRESKNRVDLWIESDDDIIVIENKIKSGINGITRSDYSQLNKYYESAEKEAEQSGKQTHYYIFAPDYASFDLSQFKLDGVYKVIHYSDIFNFFIKESATYIADRAFPDFVRGLKRHTLTMPELQFETMRSRLLKKIHQLQ